MIIYYLWKHYNLIFLNIRYTKNFLEELVIAAMLSYIKTFLRNVTYSEINIWSSSMNGISSMPKSVGFNDSLSFKDMRDWSSATLEAWHFKGWWTVISTSHPCILGLDTTVGIHLLRLDSSILFFCKESSEWTDVPFGDAFKWTSCSVFWKIKNIIHTIAQRFHIFISIIPFF